MMEPIAPVGSKAKLLGSQEAKILTRHGMDGLDRWTKMRELVGDIRCQSWSTPDDHDMADLCEAMVEVMEQEAGF